MPDVTRDRDDFDKQRKWIEDELGFDHVDSYKIFAGSAHYGVHVVSVGEDKKNDIEEKKAYVTSPNPMNAMMEVWESIMQQSMSTGLAKLGQFIEEVWDEDDLPAETVLKRMIHMLSSEKFHTTFLSQIQSVQPDLIVIGNPNIVSGFTVRGMGTVEEMTEEIETFLKEVVKEEE